MKWKHKTPEYLSGDYYFEGDIMATNTIVSKLPKEEIAEIIAHVKEMVEENKKIGCGIDYLQVYTKDDMKIFVIDQLSKDALAELSKQQKQEYNYFTIMFNHEY